MDFLYVILTALLVAAAVTMILKKVDTRLTFLFLGVIGLAAATIVTGKSVLGDGTTGNFPGEDIVSQTRQPLTNLKAILEANGMTMGDVVKTTVLLADINEFAAMNQVYGEFFTAPCFGKGRKAFSNPGFSHTPLQ